MTRFATAVSTFALIAGLATTSPIAAEDGYSSNPSSMNESRSMDGSQGDTMMRAMQKARDIKLTSVYDADALDGAEVQATDGEVIADVERLVMDGNGNIIALIVDQNGWLDLSGREAILPIAFVRTEIDGADTDFVTMLSEEQLEVLPKYEESFYAADEIDS